MKFPTYFCLNRNNNSTYKAELMQEAPGIIFDFFECGKKNAKMFILELFKDLMEINIQMFFSGYRAAVNLFVSRMPLFSCLYSIQFNLLPLPINFSRFSCDCCQILFQKEENPAIVTVNARKIYCSWLRLHIFS